MFFYLILVDMCEKEPYIIHYQFLFFKIIIEWYNA